MTFRLNAAQRWLRLTLIGLSFISTPSLADEAPRARNLQPARYVEVSVEEAYLEVHTGPGRGYPVTRVIARGEKLDILMRRTDWYKVTDDAGHQGWVDRESLSKTLLANGEKIKLDDPLHRDFDQSPWEIGFQTGNFGGGNVNSLFTRFALTDSLAAEAAVAQTLGNASSSVMSSVGLAHHFSPHWRISPFVDLGVGMVKITPKSTIVQPRSRSEQFGYYGLGTDLYLTHRLLLRADYRSYTLFSKDVPNEDRNEWKAGFAFYF